MWTATVAVAHRWWAYRESRTFPAWREHCSLEVESKGFCQCYHRVSTTLQGNLSCQVHMYHIFTVFGVSFSTERGNKSWGRVKAAIFISYSNSFAQLSYLFLHRKDDKILICISTSYGIDLIGWVSERRLGGAVGRVEILSDTLSKHCISNMGDARVQNLHRRRWSCLPMVFGGCC